MLHRGGGAKLILENLRLQAVNLAAALQWL